MASPLLEQMKLSEQERAQRLKASAENVAARRPLSFGQAVLAVLVGNAVFGVCVWVLYYLATH